ncbi:hypothetical protein A4G99_19305 [Haladaptatus sp. R4]|nr:hypothetical protein A4G99_19305 [Haladaptatus sp. R4]
MADSGIPNTFNAVGTLANGSEFLCDVRFKCLNALCFALIRVTESSVFSLKAGHFVSEGG